MDRRLRMAGAVSLVVLIFLVVQVGALALVKPFVEMGRQQVPNPQDPTNSIVYIVFILLATGVMLAAFKYGLDRFIRAFLVFVSGMLSWYVFSVFLPPVWAVVPSAAVAVALLVYPEWYVIDTAGAIMGAGAAGLFGISFGILPAIVLLSLLAVYDAISVYGTEHMLTLAEGVMDLKVPVVLAIPTTLSYSFIEATTVASVEDAEGSNASDVPDEPSDEEAVAPEETEAPIEREAPYIGLGDAVMPTILVASAAFFLSGESALVPALDVPLLLVNVPAIGAMVGTLLGLLVLMWMVLKGRPHAGLPLLNGGAILGYFLGAFSQGLTLMQALGF